MPDPITAGLSVIAAATNLAAKIQDEKNTPEMVAAAKRQAHIDFDEKRDQLEAILANDQKSEAEKTAAFQILQILDS